MASNRKTKEKEERILNQKISYDKERALLALEKAKILEKKKIDNGYSYVRITNKIIKLKKYEED